MSNVKRLLIKRRDESDSSKAAPIRTEQQRRWLCTRKNGQEATQAYRFRTLSQSKGVATKQKICSYCQKYLDNFRKKPLKAAIILLMQIFFLLGWGFFYFFLYRMYTVIVIPGQTLPVENIYAETFFTLLVTIVFSYCFYRFFKILFSNRRSLQSKISVMLGSVICAFVLLALWNSVRALPMFSQDVDRAFWAQNDI